MLGVVLRLRATTTVHQLRRDWWRVLFLVGGAIWSLSLLPGVAWGARLLSYTDSTNKADALVAFAAVVGLGWVLVPLLVTGLDDSLDPSRFAPWGLEARRVAPALAVSALLTVPALFFAFVFGAAAWTWSNENPEPWAVVVAAVGALLTWLSLVFSARLAAAWGARLLGSRKSREASLVAGLVVVALVGPAIWVVVRDGFELVLEYDLRILLEQLARTPIGAGMAAPEFAVARDWVGVAWRLGMMLAWVGVLLAAWRANISYTFVHPIFRGGGTRKRDDSVLAAGERAAARAHRRPWVRLAGKPAPGAAVAVRARLLHYWFTDPRYLSNLVGVLLVPLLTVGLILPVSGLDPRWAFIAPLLLAATIGWGRHNDVAYDSTALWLDIAAGKEGSSITRGRFAAVLIWAVPAVLVVACAVLIWTGLWSYAPALLGACVGVLGATLGVSAMTAVAFPYRAPAPGESPFGAEVGSVGAGLFAQVVSSVATAVVLPVAVVPFVLTLAVDPRWGWVSAVVGTVAGVVVYVVGTRAGGIIYDRRAGSLVDAVR